MAEIEAQGQAQSETAERSALAEMQKQEALTSSKVQIEQAKAQFEMQKLQTFRISMFLFFDMITLLLKALSVPNTNSLTNDHQSN